MSKQSDGPSSEDKAIAALRRVTDNKLLKRILREYLSGRFEEQELQSDLRLALNASDREAAAVNHLRKVTRNPELKYILRGYSAGDFESKRFDLIFRLLRSGRCVEDIMGTLASAHWLDDSRFMQAYEAAEAISDWRGGVRWRMYTLMCCAVHATQLEGDFVECGVNRGGSAMSVISYVGRDCLEGRKFYLFDTFSGLVAAQMDPDEIELNQGMEDRYPDVLELVKRTFAPYEFAIIVPGAIPDTLVEFKPEPVAYLHIDMNLALPECSALEFFWPYLSKGAPIVFDDYGFSRHWKQRDALDDLAGKLGTKIMMLPTGQGLLWK